MHSSTSSTRTIAILVISVVTLLTYNFIQAAVSVDGWDPAPANPPSGNTPAPITVGTSIDTLQDRGQGAVQFDFFSARDTVLAGQEMRAPKYCNMDGTVCATVEEMLADKVEGGAGFPLTSVATFFADSRVRSDIKNDVSRSWMTGYASWGRVLEGSWNYDYVRLKFSSDAKTTDKLCALLNAGTTQDKNDTPTLASLYTWDSNPQPDSTNMNALYDGVGMFNYDGTNWNYSISRSASEYGESWTINQNAYHTNGAYLSPQPEFRSLTQLSCGS